MFKDKEIVIDDIKSRYKKLFYLLSFIPLSDGWKTLPKVEYVAVTKVNMKQRLSLGISIVNSSTIGKDFYAVYLYGDKKNIRIEACKKQSLQSAQELGNRLSKYLNVKLIDYTLESK